MTISSTPNVVQPKSLYNAPKVEPKDIKFPEPITLSPSIGGDYFDITEIGLTRDSLNAIDTNKDSSISKDELETALSYMLGLSQDSQMSPLEFGDMMTQMGVEVPQPQQEQKQQQNKNQESDILEILETDEISTQEIPETLPLSKDEMLDYTMDIMNTLMGALKEEDKLNGTNKSNDLSSYKQVMNMINEQTQDNKTAQNISKFISNI
jgi:hypothetical protein